MTWHFNSNLKINAYKLKEKIILLILKRPHVWPRWVLHNFSNLGEQLGCCHPCGHFCLAFRMVFVFLHSDQWPSPSPSQRHGVGERNVAWLSIETDLPRVKGSDSGALMSLSFLWAFKICRNTQSVCFCGLGCLSAWFGTCSPNLCP